MTVLNRSTRSRCCIFCRSMESKRHFSVLGGRYHATRVLFRPPYGFINTTVKNISTQLGLTPIMWNVDPSDWRLPGTDVIVQRVLANTGNGSVILMHDGGGNRSQTVQALPQIIAGLQQRGFRFVTVPQLLADSARG